MTIADSAQQPAKKVPIDPLRTAVRFPLHLQATVSANGHVQTAITEDISATGVLFRTPEPVPIDTNLQWSFTLPGEVMGGETDVTVHCKGRVVRLVQSSDQWLVGAVIDEYTLGEDHE